MVAPSITARMAGMACGLRSSMHHYPCSVLPVASIQSISRAGGGAPAQSGRSHSTEAYSGVLEAVEKYQRALHIRSSPLMSTVWHPSAHLKRLGDNLELVDIPAGRFLEIVGTGDESSGEAQSMDKILSIDFIGCDTAMAKVEIVLGEKRYRDFLSLLRLKSDGWKIISKIFTSTPLGSLGHTDSSPLISCHHDISETLAGYFAAGQMSDPEAMLKVMHPSCHLYAVEDGMLYERDNATFLLDMAARPPEIEPCIYDKVISIDKSGMDSACAKLQIGFPQSGRLFTDHLSMLRVEGNWKIVSKTYTWERIQAD